MPRPNLELTIDELVLEGIPYSQRLRVAAAIERELTRLWRESAAGAEPSAQMLDLPAIEIDGNLDPEAIGGRVAQSAFAQLVTTQVGPMRTPGATQ